MADVTTEEFQAGSRRALGDPDLQRLLGKLGGFRMGREGAIEEMGQAAWDELRDRAREIKQHTIQHLDGYLEQLTDSVEAAGGAVFFARDAHEANEYVTGLARSRGVKSVIKSKSMVAEEMGIGDVLEESGVESVETDLGEYIIQLAHETPSHIIAPAIHKSKEQVSDLFASKIGVPRAEGIPELAGIAREVLRERFLRADMGMTGANFAVAETGTIAIVTNEGNGRMCTSLPRVHVATMGLEKVVPRLEDLAVFLRLLPRAATGQRITSYVTFITGPRRSDEEDGPEEFHLVILDNGRSRMLADPDLQEALFCIRCGACLNSCPVYTKVGGHAYGWVYPGPIGAVVTPMLVGQARAADLPFASSLCGACREVCPVRINIPHLLLKLRRDITQGAPEVRKPRPAEALLFKLWRQGATNPWLFALGGRVASLLQRPLLRGGKLRWLPPPFDAWTRTRDFPAVARRAFRQAAPWSRGERADVGSPAPKDGWPD